MATQDSGETSRINAIDALRGLAALYVVFGHICTLVDPAPVVGFRDRSPEWIKQAFAPFRHGNLAVAAFIVMSGFSLQMSLFNKGDGSIRSLRKFFVRRALRILPAYYGALAISIPVALYVTTRLHGMPFALYLPVNVQNVTAHLLLVQNLSPVWMYKINGVMWSISLEVQLYLLFPFIVKLAGRFDRLVMLVSTLLCGSLLYALLPDAPKLYPWYIGLFGAGMFAAHLAFRPNLRFGVRPNFAGLLAFAFLAMGVVLSGLDSLLIVQDVAFGFGIAALLYRLAIHRSGPTHSLLNWRPFVAVGAFSYSLYLLHHPVLQVVCLLRPSWLSDQAGSTIYLFFVGLPAAVILSFLFSKIFEAPFLHSKRSQAHRSKPQIDPSEMVPSPLRDGVVAEVGPRQSLSVIHLESAASADPTKK